MKNQREDIHYNVCCSECGGIWTPAVGSPLWWKAKQRADKGYLDALMVTSQECGCRQKIVHPEAPYRVVGYNDLLEAYDIPFFSLVPAAKKFLELARGLDTVSFVDKRATNGKPSRIEMRLNELV